MKILVNFNHTKNLPKQHFLSQALRNWERLGKIFKGDTLQCSKRLAGTACRVPRDQQLGMVPQYATLT